MDKYDLWSYLNYLRDRVGVCMQARRFCAVGSDRRKSMDAELDGHLRSIKRCKAAINAAGGKA